MLLAWVCNAFFDSFGSQNFWAQEQVTGSEAKQYFNDVIIGSETVGDDQKPTRLVGKNVGYAFLSWTIVYLCVAFGLKWTGRITYFTMGFVSALSHRYHTICLHSTLTEDLIFIVHICTAHHSTLHLPRTFC